MSFDHHIIQIPHDITNPTPDRRSKDWNKKPVVPAGSRFIVGETSLRMSSERYAWESPRSDLGALIMLAGDIVQPQSVRELAAVHNCDWGGDEILRVLLKLGRVGPADFIAAGNVLEDF